MMATDHTINVNEINFEYEVIAFSKNVPVLVDFWAEWCQPCKSLSPILEKLALEMKGQIRLAKVNIDENPNLARLYAVRSIPTIKAFIDGQITGEFVGAQPEARIREFISKLTPPSPIDLEIEKGYGLVVEHQWQQAEEVLRNALSQKPESAPALLNLVKALLAQGNSEEALNFLEAIPVSRETQNANLLKPYAVALDQWKENTLPDDMPLDAIFKNSLRLASQAKFPLALDGLLDILREDKRYRNGKAKEVILGILELMGTEDPLTRDYRSELASALF